MSGDTAPRAARGGHVLVLGSLNMDVVLRVRALPAGGQTVLGEDAVLRPGGKGANQAVAAALAGARVSIAGRVGDDAHAATVRAALVHAGVDVSLLRVEASRSTGFAVVLVAHDGENAIAVSPGANHALGPADVDGLRDDLRRADVLLLQMELPADAVGRAVSVAAAVDTPVVLNLAPAADVERALLRRLAVLVVNRSEAEHLLRAELRDVAALVPAARALRELGPRAVVVTAGAHGAAVSDGDGEVHLPAVPVDVVDTAGAGDAFVGALAAELSRGRALREAVTVATAAGAAAVQVHGAQLPGRSGPSPTDRLEVP